MNKLISKLDESKERMFGALIVTLPHQACLVDSPWLLVNLNMRGRFTIILINMAGSFLIINPIWPIRRPKLIGPIQKGLALYFLLLHTHQIQFIPLEQMTGFIASYYNVV